MKCEMCDNEHNGDYGSGRFCSSKCARTFSSNTLIKKTKIVQCIDCSIDIEVDFRASSLQCKCDGCRKSYKKKYKKNRICIVCGGPLKKNAKKFCSVSCSSTFINNKYIDDWKNGVVDGSRGKYKDSLSRHIRRYLFDKYDHRCSKCGWNEINIYTNKIPLQVDHIDGDYRNNSEDNLTLLCPNCHSLTHTYGGANRGNGRKNRRKSDIICEYLNDEEITNGQKN